MSLRVHRQAALFTFLFPLIPLAIFIFLYRRPGAISPLYFFLGSLLEFFISFLLLNARDKGKISDRKLHQGEYLLRTVFGLPLTIYAAVYGPLGVLALIRFFGSFLIVKNGRGASPAFLYVSFFLAGLALFSFLLGRGVPRIEHLGVLATGGFLGYLLAFRRLAELRERLRLARAARIQAAKHRLHRRAFEREQNLSRILLPPVPRNAYFTGRPPAPEPVPGILLGFVFPGLLASLEDFRSLPELDARKGLEELQREWDHGLEDIRRVFQDQRIAFGAPADPWLALWTPEGLDLSGASSSGEILEILWQRRRKEIFRLIFALGEVMAETERRNRKLEQRGRKPWRTRAGMIVGEVYSMAQGGGSPAWTYRGGALDELRTFLLQAEEESPPRSLYWLENSLGELVRPCFEETEMYRSRGWLGPTLLKPGFSREGKGLEPVPDFYEKIILLDERNRI